MGIVSGAGVLSAALLAGQGPVVSAGTLQAIRIEPLTLALSNAPPAWMTAGRAVAGPAASLASRTTTGAPADTKLVGVEEMMQPLQAGEPRTKVIVNLRAPAVFLKPSDGDLPAALLAVHKAVRRAQEDVLSALQPAEFKLRHRFQNQPGFSAEVSAASLAALANHPQVASVEPVRRLEAHLAQGISLMNGLVYRSAYNGAGVAIAVCDTGMDYTHPRLGGGGFPNSKVLGGYNFGDDSADPFPQGEPHGTCCGGIAAGDLGTVGDYIGGVAWNARLYALKISPDGNAFAYTDAMVAAWDWCVTHKNDNPDWPILAISTSFGGGRAFDFCNGLVPAMAAAASNAVAAGITILASAGNDGFCDSLAWPACISDVTSVGAVYDAAFGNYYPCLSGNSCAPKTPTPGGCASGFYTIDITAPDEVPSYSNIAPFLALLAPANAAHTTDIVGAWGYDRGDYYNAFGGTSAACPYAAGAVACLQSAAKATLGRFLTPGEIKFVLTSTGDGVTDPKAALTRPRVNLGHAIQAVQPGFTIHNDGATTLTVTSIVPDTAASWLSCSPVAPFTVPPGGAQGVSVKVDFGAAPPGRSSLRLLVYSDDDAKSPYPGGINVTVDNTGSVSPRITKINFSGADVLICFSSVPNRLYCLERKTDLLIGAWSPVQTNVRATNSVTQLIDPNALGSSPRFYRVGLQP